MLGKLYLEYTLRSDQVFDVVAKKGLSQGGQRSLGGVYLVVMISKT